MKLLITLIAVLTAATAYAGHHGKILTNKDGMTLYTFDKDADNTSNCYGGCAAKWPPYLAKEGAKAKKSWGLITRKDGSQQWTYNNQPLYTWVGDTKAGDTSGDGVGGVWHITEKKKASSYKSYGSSYDSSSDSGYSY